MKRDEMTPGLAPLEDAAAFATRHIGTTPEEQAAMLAELGYPSRAALMDAIVPPAIREQAPIPLPGAMSEAAALAKLAAIAAGNRVMKSYIDSFPTRMPNLIAATLLDFARASERVSVPYL